MLIFAKLFKKPAQVMAFTGLGIKEVYEFADVYRTEWLKRRVTAF